MCILHFTCTRAMHALLHVPFELEESLRKLLENRNDLVMSIASHLLAVIKLISKSSKLDRTRLVF